MITLYGIPGTATTAPHMVLEEIGVEYAFVLVERDEDDVPTAPPGFLALSPFGKVPALDDDGVVLTEAAAICLHLAATHPAAGLLAPPEDRHARATTVRHLMTLTNTVQPAYLRYFYAERYTADPAGVDGVRAAATRELVQLRDHFAGVIGDGPFLLGAQCSVADLYLAMLASWSSDMEPAERWWADPVIARHYDAVLARPGCRRAVEQEGGSLSSGG